MAVNKSGNKPERNDPCPCGSGKKFKRCHGATMDDVMSSGSGSRNPEDFRLVIEQLKARNLQREEQQGLGRPIISAEFQGHRFVAVGQEIRYSKKWKTFHDFLLDYIASVMGREWGSAELKKPEGARHPLFRLYAALKTLQRKHSNPAVSIQSAPPTGGAAAYLELAYNLYLLAHNADLQARLVKRLRHADQFRAAMYETRVAAAFILAGFELALEDEGDSSRSHCEFSAVHRITKVPFSVEAKARAPDKKTASVANQLHEALKKRALNRRIVFIDVNLDVNVKRSADPYEILPWLREALDSVRRKEQTLTVSGVPAPEAYVFLTSHPVEQHLDEPDRGIVFVGEGFKIPDFKMDSAFSSVREARLARERHREMFDLLQSMKDTRWVPLTFDGEIPEFAFGNEGPRLLIGRGYALPGADGAEEVGTLEQGIVSEPEAKAIGVFRLADGRNVIASIPLSDDEMVAYRRHPDTFFGVVRKQARRAHSALDLFDFFHESYRYTPKERLLELMKEHLDVEALASLKQEELATLYCERMAEGAVRATGAEVKMNAENR